MVESFLHRYFNKDYPAERKGFYLASFSAVVMFTIILVMSVLLGYGMTSAFYQFFGLILIVLDIYFAEQTNHFRVCSLCLVFIADIMLLPVIYIINGRLISGVFVYFVPGILLCIVALDGIEMVVSSVVALTVLCSSVCYVYYIGESTVDINPAIVMVEQIVAVLYSGICSGICVRFKVYFYSEENEHAKAARSLAEKTSEAKNVFLSNMSHEVRTPMNAILGTSQLLMESDIEDNSKDKVLNILNACNALISTVGDLLDFSRIETGRITIEKGEYDFVALMDDIVNMIAVRVMDKGIEFLVNIDPDIPTQLYGDSKYIRQVFINVLNNAVKYTKEGNITLTVRREIYEEGSLVLVVSVKDTGIGIRDNDKERIFQDFERIDTKETGLGEVEGTGLGLSICKEILYMMDGDLTFDSVYQEGSEFVFRVPQEIVGEDKGPHTFDPEVMAGYKALIFEANERYDNMLQYTLEQMGVEADSAMGGVMFRSLFSSGKYTHVFIDRDNYIELEGFLSTRLDGVKLTVLTDINQTNVEGYPGSILVRPLYNYNVAAIFEGSEHSSIRKIKIAGDLSCPGVRVMTVDDNLTNLQVVEAMLNRYDMEVFTASGGQECLYRLENQEVDIIFLDYMMPEMDGVDTLKHIREMDAPWVKDVPIIALTANAVSGVREMLLDAGFDDYISKPIQIDRLEKAICHFLPEDKIRIKTGD